VAPARRLRVLRPPSPQTVRPLDGRAADDLRFIRETMESVAFTAVPGKGGVAMGVVGCASAVAASLQTSAGAWLAAWLVGAAAAVGVGAVAVARKAQAVGRPALFGVGSKFARGLTPPLVAGAVLTAALARAGLFSAMPGTWLLLYGAGLMTAGAFSARVVPVMGASFMTLGTAALLTPAAWGDLWMALGFGGLHMAFGLVIWRRHGG
jgi:hypothetical protein